MPVKPQVAPVIGAMLPAFDSAGRGATRLA
jgi:hypothetical protein